MKNLYVNHLKKEDLPISIFLLGTIGNDGVVTPLSLPEQGEDIEGAEELLEDIYAGRY